MERYFTLLISRRDPSRIVKANGKYYVWYTLRNTPTTFMGAEKATDIIPSADWDLGDIAYATSTDGFNWVEQGIAVHRPEKPTLGWRSVCTPDVLYYEGKYYLYYQAFSQISGLRGDDCPVAVSWADSPEGPWHAENKIVIPNGEKGSWDQYSIHDPQPIVYNGKIYLYYKSDYNDQKAIVRSTGVAISDSPLGPFEKYELNPVMSSGHETQLFRFKEGIAAILSMDGHEANTIQYSPDGINFDIASITNFLPIAAGLYDPDAFTDTKYAHGVTWGLSTVCYWGEKRGTFMIRFDCDLSLDLNDSLLKKNIGSPFLIDELRKRPLQSNQKARAIEDAKRDLGAI
ncbi:MAG: family 43 glycosylhydrolase [Rikenellaceae bacterium]